MWIRTRSSMTNTNKFDGMTLDQLLWREWELVVRQLTRKVKPTVQKIILWSTVTEDSNA